jgi:hypothetical protein
MFQSRRVNNCSIVCVLPESGGLLQYGISVTELRCTKVQGCTNCRTQCNHCRTDDCRRYPPSILTESGQSLAYPVSATGLNLGLKFNPTVTVPAASGLRGYYSLYYCKSQLLKFGGTGHEWEKFKESESDHISPELGPFGKFKCGVWYQSVCLVLLREAVEDCGLERWGSA